MQLKRVNVHRVIPVKQEAVPARSGNVDVHLWKCSTMRVTWERLDA